MCNRSSVVDSLFHLLSAGLPLPAVSGGAEDPPPTPAEGKTPEPTPDLSRTADALVAKHGDSTAALMVLLGENYKARDTIRELKARIPADGSRVLPADDAKAWDEYANLGKPSEIRKAISEGATAKTEAEGYRREKHHAAVASDAKFHASVHDTLAVKDGLTLLIKDEKDQAGKPIRVAHVQGEGDKTTPLADYAETHWKDFLPALKTEPTKPVTPGGSPSFRETAPRPHLASAVANGQPLAQERPGPTRKNVF